jgi:hypothetical protein
MVPGIGEIHSSGRGHIGDEQVQYRRGHSRDRRDRNGRDYKPFHISSSSEVETKYKDHISVEAKDEGDMGPGEDYPEGSGGGSEQPFDSTRSMLNDLARGQQEMRNAIAQMALNSQIIQNSLSTIGASIARGAVGHTRHQGGAASGSNGNVPGTSG